jgi:hypothetical protein
MILAALAAAATLHASLAPAAPAPNGLLRVTVTGLPAPAADVVIHGGIASGGKMFGLVPLRDEGGGDWTTVLRAPGFLGVYPVRVRARGVYHETGALVTVLPRAYAAEPGVNTPAEAVEWWRRQSPEGATIASETPWDAGFYFHLDQRYNRLIRVRFTLLGPWRRYHLGAGTYTRWLEVSRTSLAAGSWKLVQVVAAP